jgi:DNA polymerase-3 subunit epsilon
VGARAGAAGALSAAGRPALRVVAPTAEELAAHAAYLAALDKESKGQCLWLRTEA